MELTAEWRLKGKRSVKLKGDQEKLEIIQF